ncbi:MAG: hypothetical protein WC058_03730 [Phycisphaeraceae bacterium]
MSRPDHAAISFRRSERREQAESSAERPDRKPQASDASHAGRGRSATWDIFVSSARPHVEPNRTAHATKLID